MTKYSKGVPWVSAEEVREKNEENMMEGERLYEFAAEFWERKKNVK